MSERRDRSSLSSRLVIGLIIVAIGTILLVGNLGWLDARYLLRTVWPLALVAAGVAMLRDSTNRKGRPWAWVFITVGLWIFADKIGWVQFNIWELIVPGILLFVGGTLVLRAVNDPANKKQLASADDSAEFVRSFAFMSYCDLHPVSRPFRGGDLNAVMGGIKLDLRDVRMESDRAVLDVFAFWGGIEIRVPPDWVVSSTVTTIIGGLVDSRRPSTIIPSKTLVVRGFNIMSGIEVKN